MEHRSVVRGTVLLSLLMFAACDPADLVVPAQDLELTIREASAVNLLGPTDYLGHLRPGQVVVCTSKDSEAATYIYTISVANVLPSDKYVTTANIPRGTCQIVFATKRRGGIEPVVQVTRPASTAFSASLVIDGTSPYSPANDQIEGDLDFYLPNEGPTTFTFSVYEGTVSKFYHDYYEGSGFGGVGGHGGTGTRTFDLD